MTKALFVLTAADHWTLNDASQHPTGFWAEEFTTPYGVFRDAGWDLTVATPGGRKPVADPASLNDEQEAILAELASVIDNPAALEDVDPDGFRRSVLPGRARPDGGLGGQRGVVTHPGEQARAGPDPGAVVPRAGGYRGHG